MSQYIYSCSEISLEDTLAYTLDPTLRESVSLELRVRAGGEDVTYSNYIAITCPPDWWFISPPPGSCPAGEPMTTNAAFERFERGFMVWLAETDTFYVFFDSPERPYLIFYGPLYLVTPAAPTPENPPDGFYAPTNGFGLLWRGEVPGAENIQSWLGWALEPEYNFTATYQYDAASLYYMLYLEIPDDKIVALNTVMSLWFYWR
jgi:hypothetical protein